MAERTAAATSTCEERDSCERGAFYTVSDRDMASGSTLGAPRISTVIKATGAIAKIYSVDSGQDLFGTVVVHHWDVRAGLALEPEPGTFTLYPEHQERRFRLRNGVGVQEDIFALDGGPHHGEQLDPPAVYYTIALRNDCAQNVEIASYAFCELRGQTDLNVVACYDPVLTAIVAWNASHPDHVRLFGCSEQPASFETTLDAGKAVAMRYPGPLSCRTDAPPGDPLGAFHLIHTLRPGEQVAFYFLLTFAPDGRERAEATYRACPPAAEALARTTAYYRDMLGRAVVRTPSPAINRGVLWAKANMLRSERRAPTGWAFTNDPTRSSNVVVRDTAWFGFGADYLTPEFVREALLALVERQEENGLAIEYYNMRTGDTADDVLNINDDTPLLIHALWHHYGVTGDEAFLRRVYPAAVKAARYILSQRNEQGLVWCNARAAGPGGIIGWRNAMQHQRLSGATTEVNSECYGALQRVSTMAQLLDRPDERAEFADQAAALKEAINTHLLNPENGLYYLNIDVDGCPRGEVTTDLVFPVMFGVASDETAARIVRRLSAEDFWTPAGLRVLPRGAPRYSPDEESGLMGGVWVGVTFWFAFAAARFSPEFMDHGLSTSFENYSRNPRQNNTVPGQFSEWLHGETLVNQGMMLSPWFPPRYLWAAIEGAGGLDLRSGTARLDPLLAPYWKWLAVQRLPYRDRSITWLVARTPEPQIYTTHRAPQSPGHVIYEEDITPRLRVEGAAVTSLALRRGADALLFAGNDGERTVTVRLAADLERSGAYVLRCFDSLQERWSSREHVAAEAVRAGMLLEIERKGFCLLELTRTSPRPTWPVGSRRLSSIAAIIKLTGRFYSLPPCPQEDPMPRIAPESRQERRQILIDAAWHCAATKRFGDLTVDDVCAAAGVSKGAFYGYFDSKQDLLLALLDQDAAELDRLLGELDAADLDSAERLRRFTQAMLELGDRPARVQVRADLWADILTDTVVRTRFSTTIQRRRDTVRRWLETGIAAGELAEVPTNAVASILLALGDGLLLHAGLDAAAFRWRNIQRALDVLLAALAPPPAPQSDGGNARPQEPKHAP